MSSHRCARLSLVVTALTLGGLLAACGASGHSGSSTSSATTRGDSMAAGAPEAAPVAAPVAADVGRAPGGVAVPTGAAVISTGTVSLHAVDVDTLLFDVQKAVDQVGGEIAERTSESDDDGRLTRSRLVLRMPATSFGDLMGALERVGTLVSSSSTSQDVTPQVIDNQVRVSAQKASIERIQALLAQAVDLKDIVAIEAELATRQAELNSLEQTQAYLADQTSQSTITVSLERSHVVAVKKSERQRSAFLAGLSAGWGALAGVGSALATLVGVLLPWLVVIGVVAVPVGVAARRFRRRTTGAVTT